MKAAASALQRPPTSRPRTTRRQTGVGELIGTAERPRRTSGVCPARPPGCESARQPRHARLLQVAANACCSYCRWSRSVATFLLECLVPGLVNACPPRPADRQSVELIRSILQTFGLDLVFASPGLVQSVEVHDRATCHCVDHRICCPQLGTDHFALTVTLRFNVVSAVPSPNTTLQIRSWPTLLQAHFHEVQHWVQQVNEVNSIAHSFTKAELDMLYSSFLVIIWKG